MKPSIGIKGLEETVRGMKNLGEQAQHRIIRNAARTGATTVKRALKQAAPRGDERSDASTTYGTLRSNIKSVQLRANGKFLPYYKVTTDDAFWGSFLDTGTGKYNYAPGPRAKGIAARTHIFPNYWFRNAIEQVRPSVTAAMVENIRRSFVREWAKVK